MGPEALVGHLGHAATALSHRIVDAGRTHGAASPDYLAHAAAEKTQVVGERDAKDSSGSD
jgi:hypothetical protein